jgi:hypothetical protein
LELVLFLHGADLEFAELHLNHVLIGWQDKDRWEEFGVWLHLGNNLLSTVKVRK